MYNCGNKPQKLSFIVRVFADNAHFPNLPDVVSLQTYPRMGKFDAFYIVIHRKLVCKFALTQKGGQSDN